MWFNLKIVYCHYVTGFLTSDHHVFTVGSHLYTSVPSYRNYLLKIFIAAKSVFCNMHDCYILHSSRTNCSFFHPFFPLLICCTWFIFVSTSSLHNVSFVLSLGSPPSTEKCFSKEQRHECQTLWWPRMTRPLWFRPTARVTRALLWVAQCSEDQFIQSEIMTPVSHCCL